MSGNRLKEILETGARPFECHDCGVVHWLSEKDGEVIRRSTVELIRARLLAHEPVSGDHRYCGPYPDDCLVISEILDEVAASSEHGSAA